MMVNQIKDRSWVEIDLSAFRHNLRQLKSLLKPGQSFLQIVKADAYGHGAFEIGRTALEEGASCLGVANAEEGKLLRIQGCKAPILILSPSLPEEAEEIISFGLTPTISDPIFASLLEEVAARADQSVNVHLKLDSGMRRSGASLEAFPALCEHVSSMPHLKIEGIFSHYAASESDPEFSRSQLDSFIRRVRPFKNQVRYLHIANSAALLNGLTKGSNLIRLGILSYGTYTHPDQKSRIALKPVMTFRSHIAQIKELKTGEAIGYNLSWTASRDTIYGIVPVGYADGYDFLLSNRGRALVNQSLCPVIGRVSMDMICIDLTDAPQSRVGDGVTLLGAGNDAIRAEALANSYQGSAYELLCQVGRRARRYFTEGGNISHSAPLARRDFVSSDFSDSKLNQIIQSAISQRLQNEEIGELISREILRVFFFNRDQDIHYRQKFVHHIQLEHSDQPEYWQATTRLSFSKVLQNDYFLVACATSDEALKRYFKRKEVEYRWLMDDKFELIGAAFQLTDVYVNDLKLDTLVRLNNSCLEIRCQHPDLKQLVGQEVSFRINTRAYYPKASHQLSVFITELTHGVKVRLDYPPELQNLEVVPVFSGQNRYPKLTRVPGSVTVSTQVQQWVFPLSGVVFAF